VARLRGLQYPINQLQTALHPSGQFEVVGDDDEAGVEFLVEFLHQFKQGVRAAAVEVAGGFIGQHAGRFGHQRTRHGGALTFAAGELGGVMLQALRQPHLFSIAAARGSASERFMPRISSGIATFSSAVNSGSR